MTDPTDKITQAASAATETAATAKQKAEQLKADIAALKAPYPLKEPVTLEGGEVLSEIKMRKPRGADLLVMDEHKGDMAKAMALTAQLSDRTFDEICELSAADITGLGEVLSPFMS